MSLLNSKISISDINLYNVFCEDYRERIRQWKYLFYLPKNTGKNIKNGKSLLAWAHGLDCNFIDLYLNTDITIDVYVGKDDSPGSMKIIGDHVDLQEAERILQEILHLKIY